MAAGLVIGACTGLGSSTGYALAWVALTGLGLGLAMPSAMNVALGAAVGGAQRRSGGALISAMRQVGSTIGVAVLGTRDQQRLHQPACAWTGCPRPPRRQSGRASPAASRWRSELGSPALLDMVRSAFVHGMDIMLWTCGGIAVVCALLALAFLPRRAAAAAGRAGGAG